MRIMKNCLLLVLALAVVLCLCACGETNKPTEPTKPAETVKPVETTKPTEATTEPTDDGKVTYTVTVVDDSGKPLSGVAVQLCDEFCVFASTNGDGIAEFRLAPGAYHASVMALPEGYAHVGEQVEFDFAEGSTELTITLKAAG